MAIAAYDCVVEPPPVTPHCFLIEPRGSRTVLGSTGFGFETCFRATVGYVLAKDAGGRGYATEALRHRTEFPNLEERAQRSVMHDRKTSIALILATLLITGCVRNAVLNEVSREEANAFRSHLPYNPGLSGLRRGDYAGLAKKDSLPSAKPEGAKENSASGSSYDIEHLWIQAHVAAGILEKDKSVEKFEEGSLKATSASGEMFKGNFIGYRPRGKEHCTRSWLSNLYYFDSRGGYSSAEGGVAVLKGDRGTALLCTYGWIGPDCERAGICKAKESRYYRLTF